MSLFFFVLSSGRQQRDLHFAFSPPAAAASAAATSAGLEETERLSRRTDVKVTSACDKGAGIRLCGEAFLRFKKKKKKGKYWL